MLWVGVWVVLVLVAAGLFFLLGRDLWRKARALTRELGTATDRLTEIADRLGSLDVPDPGHSDVGSQGTGPRQQR